MQGRSLDTYGIASGEDFLVHLTDRSRACTRVVPQRLKEADKNAVYETVKCG